MRLIAETWPETWHRSRLFRVLSLGGHVAVDLSKAVTGLGALLLVGVAATHLYPVTRAMPGHFVVGAAAGVAGCLLAARALGFGRNPLLPRAGWLLGTLAALAALGLDFGARDLPPAAVALACAGAFIVLHAFALAIDAAHPGAQQWED